MFLEWENNSGKLQIISGKFQNNAVNDVKQISLSHVIMSVIFLQCTSQSTPKMGKRFFLDTTNAATNLVDWSSK